MAKTTTVRSAVPPRQRGIRRAFGRNLQLQKKGEPLATDGFHRLLDAAGLVPWQADVGSLRCTYIGRLAEKMLGYPVARWLEKDFWTSHLHPDDREHVVELFRAARRRGEGFKCEYRMLAADGRAVWISHVGADIRTLEGGKRLSGFLADITARKETEAALRGLSGRLISGQEEERRRIARELHDGVSQSLALVAVELESLGRERLSPEALSEQVAQVLVRLREASSWVHALSHQLHPAKLEHLGLVAALRGLCRDLRQHGLIVVFANRNVPRPLPPEVALCLYRTAQEALQNVVKHSGANRAEVEVIGERDALALRVTDGGKGFDLDAPEARQGLGLVSMRERVRLLGGALAVRSAAGQGTSLEARVPLHSDGPSDQEEHLDEARAAG